MFSRSNQKDSRHGQHVEGNISQVLPCWTTAKQKENSFDDPRHGRTILVTWTRRLRSKDNFLTDTHPAKQLSLDFFEIWGEYGSVGPTRRGQIRRAAELFLGCCGCTGPNQRGVCQCSRRCICVKRRAIVVSGAVTIASTPISTTASAWQMRHTLIWQEAWIK